MHAIQIQAGKDGYRRDGVAVRVSALQSVDFVLISLVKSYLNMVSMAFLLGAQHERDSVENNLASSLAVFLGKTLNGTPPSARGRHVVSKQCVCTSCLHNNAHFCAIVIVKRSKNTLAVKQGCQTYLLLWVIFTVRSYVSQVIFSF